MSRPLRSYWHDRLERWGAWRVGAFAHGAAKVATWARMRSDCSLASWAASDDAVPRTFLEERETHAFIAFLAARSSTAELAGFALAAYPNTSRLAAKLGVDKRTLDERYKRLHRVCARLLSQRKEGQPLDASQRRPRPKAVTMRAQWPGDRRPRAVASAAADE